MIFEEAANDILNYKYKQVKQAVRDIFNYNDKNINFYYIKNLLYIYMKIQNNFLLLLKHYLLFP